jgi:hypothetical protein
VPALPYTPPTQHHLQPTSQPYRQDEDHFQGTPRSASLAALLLTHAQDLKQNKFVIEAEPSETVRRPATAHVAAAG